MIPVLFALTVLASATTAAPRIPAAMVSSISSSTAKIGEEFTFKTTRDAIVGGTAIPSGTIGEGTVTAVSPAAGNHRGTLSLTPHYLLLANGKHLPVTSATATAYAARRHFFGLPIPGVMVIGVENPGGNVTIGPGTTFEVAPVQSP